MSIYSNSVQTRIDNAVQDIDLSSEAVEVLNLLDDIEEFTLNIRKRILYRHVPKCTGKHRSQTFPCKCTGKHEIILITYAN